MNFGSLFHVVWPYLLQTGTVAFALFLGHHVKNQTDSQRAQAIAKVAEDVAATVYANNPNLAWLDLVQQVVRALSAATGVPTNNTEVLTRAATGALMRLGAKK